jgi:NAD(P)-dependent dehydrogenase (short-subunit alcohol dehydrogenase family)
MIELTGRVALVTGASRGIGKAIAGALARQGAHVVAAGRGDNAKSVVDEITAAGGKAEAIALDVTEPGANEAAVAGIVQRLGRIDILVNNAGTNWGAPLADYSDDAFQKVLATNVKSVFNLTRELLPLLRKAGTHEDPARVINIGSIDGLHVPVLETYAYSASKAAVHHLTRTLARQLASEHITVNAVAPGPFQSKMMKETLEKFGDMIVAQVPRGRIGEPEDMAGIAIFLASRAGAYITGAVIPVDGGMSTCV